MRIGVDIRALMERRTTGVQVYISELLNALFQLDQKNQYVLFANGAKLNRSDLPEFDYPNVETRVFHYPNKAFGLAQKFLNLPKVDRLLDGIDLFFSPHWRASALSESVPLIATFHDLSFELFPEFFNFRQRLWHRFMGYRKAALKADRIIAVSENTRDDLMNAYKVSEKMIKVIYSGVKIDRGARKRENEMNGYFLFFATFEPRKNLPAVLAAYQDYHKKSRKPIKLVLAGSRGWKVKLPKESKDIMVLNNVTEAKKNELYSGCFALIFPSFYEGFGFPVLEAASFSKPVILSSASSLPEIGKGFSLFINPMRPQQITQAMLELEKDQALYNRLSREAVRTAERFSWQNTAKQTLGLFREYGK